MKQTWMALGLMLATTLATVAVLHACSGDDEDYGQACDSDRDCDGLCAEGGDYPDGLCTYRCDDERDCPGGWTCVSKAGGICLELCSSERECEDHFGRKWTCKNVDLEGRSGKDPVCIGD